MGYTSQVAIRCGKEAYRMFKEAFSGPCGAPPDKEYASPDGSEFQMEWDWVKWEPSFYKDIRAIADVMSELDDIGPGEDGGTAYKMLRLGESDGDVEERANGGETALYYERIFTHDGLAPRERGAA